MPATVIPFPKFPTVGNTPRDIVHVEPSPTTSEWEVIVSPARGGRSTIEGTYPDFSEADTFARVIAQVRGAHYAAWHPSDGDAA